MAFLKREEILAARLRHEDVEVPEWGGTVRIWEMSGAERLAFEEAFREAPAVERLAHLVRACAGDEAGRFDPPLDVAELQGKSSTAILRLHAVAMRLSVLSQQAAEDVRGN